MNVVTSLLHEPDPHPAAIPSAEQVLEVLPHPVLVVGADGIVIYANTACETSLGQAVGIDVHGLFPGFTSGLASMTGIAPCVVVSGNGENFDAAFASFGDGHFLIDLRPRSDETTATMVNALDELTGLTKRTALLSHLSAALSDHSIASSIAVH